MTMKFNGAITALVTPFKDQNLDLISFDRLLDHQLAGGVQGFVVNGTTGESPTLSSQEVEILLARARAKVPTHVPLIVGVGTNSTAQTLRNAKQAEAWGADALLVVVPYYNKPPQRGLFEHFKQVADASQVPVILYNVPGRTITTLELETISKLAEHPNIVAIKEASGKMDFAAQIYQTCGSKLQMLSGDDESYESFLKVGGQGIISVASHLIPEAFVAGRIEKYQSLIQACYLEANPIPVKMALHLMGLLDSPECRSPLVTALDSTTQRLRQELLSFGLVK